VNLDYAASTPALRVVAAQIAELLPLYSSVHRGAGYASMVCTTAYEAARADIAAFAGARDDDVVVITRNTTDALNLLANAVPGPAVHLDIEHHANLLPWQARHGRVVSARGGLGETMAALDAELASRPAALLAITGASNVTGECLPLRALAEMAHRHGARIAVDGAQLAPHRRVDLAATDIDYFAFSGHKIYAPFGAGALIGRRDWPAAVRCVRSGCAAPTGPRRPPGTRLAPPTCLVPWRWPPPAAMSARCPSAWRRHMKTRCCDASPRGWQASAAYGYCGSGPARLTRSAW
jgi:selenocysteine lyase/cysteine desulfurase